MTIEQSPKIKRRCIQVDSHSVTSIANDVVEISAEGNQAQLTALVINSSQEMAKEITMQLTLTMPGCSITYAPTIEVAKWILAKKKIDLIVSSPVLPDGGIARLNKTLQKMDCPPDVVVVGDVRLKNAELFNDSGYQFATIRRFGAQDEAPKFPRIVRKPAESKEIIKSQIKTLGADLRNDLNNPLQEIVAMVFVAQAGTELAPGTAQALKAIEGAAKNMAGVVKGLEDKIRCAVSE